MKNQEKLKSYLEKIDCNLPYSDFKKCKSLIDEAIDISEEAVYAVVHEIVRVPKGAVATLEDRKELLHYIDSSFKHPLKETVFNLSISLIESRQISPEIAISAMNKISTFKGCYGALNIAYFSCWNDEVEKLYNSIKIKWKDSQF
jgi:hypothetical protein